MVLRGFIALVGVAALAWPLAAQPQQAIPVIGFLHAGSPHAPAMPHVAAFRQGLKEAGFVEGRNVAIEFRWAEHRYERLPELASDLVRRRVVVLVATGGEPPVIAAKRATSTIPVVFCAGGDPVEAGFVTSLNRPAGNATGISMITGLLEPKRIELLRDAVPGAATVAVLLNPKHPHHKKVATEIDAAARSLGLQTHIRWAGTEADIEGAFASFVERRPDALLVASDPYFTNRRDQIVALAARHSLPAMYFIRDFPEAGGLMSYGADLVDVHRQAGVYAGRILKGEKPADLPVLQSTKYELVINLKTAKALGLTIPPTLLARADEVIE